MDLKGIYTADANRYGEAEALYKPSYDQLVETYHQRHTY